MRETREWRRLLTVRDWVIRELVWGCLLLAGWVWAPLGAQGQASQPERVALVVGNSDYVSLRDLPNAGNDADDIADALERLDFSVTKLTNVSHGDLNAGLKSFSTQAREAAMALVFYAGHGLSKGRVNYLVPVDAKLALDTHVPFETLALADVLASTEGAGLRVVILDACRNLPQLNRIVSTDNKRSVSRGGFVGVDEAGLDDEVLVAFAAAEGQTASDGEQGQGNSPYTAALLSQLEQPQDFGLLFRAVRDQVLKETRSTQRPVEYSTLRKPHFLAGKPTPAREPVAGAEVGPTAAAQDAARTQLEGVFWESIRESKEWKDYVEYLRKYPNGNFIGLAQRQLKRLAGPKYRYQTSDSEINGGLKPLHIAAIDNDVDTARVLLKAGVGVSAERKYDIGKPYGDTPLHYAAMSNAADVAQVLLDAGADVSAECIQSWGGKKRTALEIAAQSGSVKTVRVLLDAGANVSATFEAGWTPLQYAAANGNVAIVRTLLEAGADVRAGNGGGWTPLHYAAHGNHVDVARMLMEAGADISAEDNEGWTPLRRAADEEDNADVVQVLLERGASRSEVPSSLRDRLPK